MQISLEIIWNTLSLDEWEKRFSQIKRSTLLQSYPYARAMCAANHQKARWGLIVIDGKEAGLVQILEAGFLGNLFHGVILDRGPLWFDGFGSAAHIQGFFQAFNKEFPPRFGRKRRIIPEIADGPAARTLLLNCGLKHNPDIPAYQTLWWDITVPEETARAQLKQKWRNSLNKALKSNLSVQWDGEDAFYPWLREKYALDKQKRGFPGPSPKFLDNLVTFSTPENPIIIGRALINNKAIAAILMIRHGRSATYQIGWTSEEGRKNCAHHLLVWEARHILTSYGVETLDLGGVNDETAQGIKKFKHGTNAEPFILVGQYS
ncbi:MAG: GNAT family N-acetyltransferase [Alphaproteobacteria bacterium]|nr:GNAT family N-acetyltransferase [Alphaproteobacteria bacterium]